MESIAKKLQIRSFKIYKIYKCIQVFNHVYSNLKAFQVTEYESDV